MKNNLPKLTLKKPKGVPVWPKNQIKPKMIGPKQLNKSKGKLNYGKK